MQAQRHCYTPSEQSLPNHCYQASWSVSIKSCHFQHWIQFYLFFLKKETSNTLFGWLVLFWILYGAYSGTPAGLCTWMSQLCKQKSLNLCMKLTAHCSGWWDTAVTDPNWGSPGCSEPSEQVSWDRTAPDAFQWAKTSPPFTSLKAQWDFLASQFSALHNLFCHSKIIGNNFPQC